MSRAVEEGRRSPLRRLGALLMTAILAAGACQQRQSAPRLPAASELDGLYGARATARLNGNVVDVRVEQPPSQLARGGRLWAKVGPYIYLFSPQTQELFSDHPGVAAVRVTTHTPDGEAIARATLRRDALNALTWKEARRRGARARRQGTDKPGYLEDLVDYGEERTSHEYNPAYLN